MKICLELAFSGSVALASIVEATGSSLRNVHSQLCPPQHPIAGLHLRSIFNEFVDEFYQRRNFQGALEKYVAENLIQHNPQISDGRQAQLDAVTSILRNYDGPEYQIIMVDEAKGYGSVFSRFRGKSGTGLPVAGVMDIYRFEAGCMVEHWDVIESLPANATNPNPF